MKRQRLGINIDHVATIRNARGGIHPEPVNAALLAEAAGADSITVHLREDRRHIIDSDVFKIIETIKIPLNLEMAATDEMFEIALKVQSHAVCIVPEKRQERTTEGGLDAKGAIAILKPMVTKLQENGSRVSLFIEPDKAQIDAAAEIGARAIELHTGKYCDLLAEGDTKTASEILVNMQENAKYATGLGIEVHAGHGINYDNVKEIAKIPEIVELNIGHYLIGEAIFVGLEASIKKMRDSMDKARIGE